MTPLLTFLLRLVCETPARVVTLLEVFAGHYSTTRTLSCPAPMILIFFFITILHRLRTTSRTALMWYHHPGFARLAVDLYRLDTGLHQAFKLRVGFGIAYEGYCLSEVRVKVVPFGLVICVFYQKT